MTSTALPAPARPRFLGLRITPLTLRRLAAFRANRRGYWSMWIFIALFVVTVFAEFIANDRPLLIRFDGHFYSPVLQSYPETTFGGDFETEADYKDPYVVGLIKAKGWMLWPLIPYDYRSAVLNLPGPAPTPPDARNWLGTDDQARDVLARVIYGYRISVLFGLTLMIFCTPVGIAAGALQGYFGGKTDLIFQRFLEIFGSLPTIFVLMILASVVTPNFWWLLGIMLVTNWTWPVGLVRAEFLRARNFEYVRAARALGVSNLTIMLRHLLPNAMVSTLTFLPFQVGGAVTLLTALDFLGFGLPPGSPSLGEILHQAQTNLQAPWLGITGFVVLGTLLTLLVFIGEAVRDAFDPRKNLA
ncbi:MAG: microcin transport system permease protein [Rhodospirillaceae bacterium]|jgi:microcin C transport system permease protein|nr:microcin transport system permease protein [Rhodospirillaceae bacterium]